MHKIFYAAALLTLAAGPARADGHLTLRLATSAPDGTFWARELKAMARDVESGTHGAVLIKIFWGGIAGDEREVGGRIQRGQLDGAISGGDLCMNTSPTMRVVSVRGVFNSRDEASYVMNRMRPTLDEEFKKSGYVYVAATGLGPDLLFSRRPVRTMDALKQVKQWHWDIDARGLMMAREIGFQPVALPLEEGARAYEEGRVDGFIINPTAALAFQWSGITKYILTLPLGYSYGCLMIAGRAFERLTLDQQQMIRSAGAKAAGRIDEIGRQQDELLLGGVFQKQGLTTLAPEESMRSEFLAAARAARERLGDKLIPAGILEQVLAMLADYRAEHREPSVH